MSKTFAVVFLLIVLLAMFMHAKGILKPAVETIVEPSEDTHLPTLGKIGMALVIYFVLISFLDDEESFQLTLLVALGALLVDYETGRGKDLLGTLLS